jgi:hypothetical protein
MSYASLVGNAAWSKNAEQSFARRRRLKSITSKSECNNEVTAPQADVSRMYPRNALQQAGNPKSCAHTDRVFLPNGHRASCLWRLWLLATY